MKEPPVEMVTWVDSSSWSGWRPLPNALTHTISDRCLTAGFLIGETDQEVLIAQSLAHHTADKGQWDDSSDNIMAIPKVAITKRVVLRTAKGGWVSAKEDEG